MPAMTPDSVMVVRLRRASARPADPALPHARFVDGNGGATASHDPGCLPIANG